MAVPSASEEAARQPSQLPDWLLFLGKFLRYGTAIASVAPSSRYLSRSICDGIDYASARCLVELGAGTGPVTAEILRRASPTCCVIIIERDPDFCARLRQRFPCAEIVEDDVVNLDRILEKRGIERVDHFLCGLPLPSFPAEARDKILTAVHRRLAPDGTFRALTEIPWVFIRWYRRYFGSVRFRFVLRNLPPAGFYICRTTTS